MTAEGTWTTFKSLSRLSGLTHAFTLRHPAIDVAVDREEALRRLAAWHRQVVTALGFPPESLATAHQVHGCRVQIVEGPCTAPLPDTDGLLCNVNGLMLGIHVADCCAVYLVDRATGACGLLHSGRKGTEQNITGVAIARMREHFGTAPEDLVVQLSPCIRPPAYEVDFAAIIRQQALIAGVRPENLHDDGTCTSRDLSRFYSYRMERGKTGRMLALLGKNAQSCESTSTKSGSV